MKLTSLWTKVVLYCLVLGSLFLWLLLYEVPRRQNISINLHAVTELESVAQLLAISTRYALQDDNLMLLEELQGSLWQEDITAFAAVYLDEPDGSSLIAYYPSTLDMSVLESHLDETDSISASAMFSAGDLQGRVITGLLREANRDRMIERQVPLYVAAGLILLLGLSMLFMLRRRVIAPLQEASRYAAGLNAGSYDKPLTRLAGSDEVVALQRSLLELSKGLESRDKEQQRLMRKLKAKVQQLQKANMDAEQSFMVKQRFVANVSHEIRTPLNGILGLSHLLLHDDLSPAQRDKVNKVVNSGQHLLSIIDDILDYSKVNAGKLVLQNTRIVTEQLISTVIAMVQPLAAEKKLELIVDCHPDFPAVFVGDQQRLTQILLNFLNNAIKFTSKGFVALDFSRDEQINGVPGICFKVRDSGPGLSEEEQAILFQEFQQVDNSLTREAGGTGLGLAICRKLAEAMGGSVGVSSEVGVGSCFEACIPLQEAELPRPDISSEDKQPMNILVVDDNPFTTQVLCQKLSQRFTNIVSAKGGAEAMQKFLGAETDNNPFDIVLLDWLMPTIDGISAATYMRAFTKTSRKLVIIGMTSSTDAMREAIAESQNNSFDRILNKPLFGDALYDVIFELMSAGKAVTDSAYPEKNVSEIVAYAPFYNRRVLLVEDMEINQEVAVGFMEKFGLSIDIANHGEEALERLASVEHDYYDLIFLDIQMPVMDGLTAARRIREQPRFASLPIIAMTASANTSDRQDCFEAGMNDYLSKPIKIDLLYAMIFKWLRDAKRQRSKPLTVNDTVKTVKPNYDFDLESLHGFDTESAMILSGGDEQLLKSLLLRVCDTWPAFLDDIQKPLQPENKHSLLRVTHSLAGIAGQIGAKRTEELARKTENILEAIDWGDALHCVQLRASIAELQCEVEYVIEQIRDVQTEKA
ncbi:response regulator [Gammaproteobacteria bacterium LSUCC0112]|nr:response regulator [Gammaproteobacteria bacterium LSUCC0112]